MVIKPVQISAFNICRSTPGRRMGSCNKMEKQSAPHGHINERLVRMRHSSHQPMQDLSASHDSRRYHGAYNANCYARNEECRQHAWISKQIHIQMATSSQSWKAIMAKLEEVCAVSNYTRMSHDTRTENGNAKYGSTPMVQDMGQTYRKGIVLNI